MDAFKGVSKIIRIFLTINIPIGIFGKKKRLMSF